MSGYPSTASQLGAGSPIAERSLDAVDRMRELLQAAVSAIDNNTSRLHDIFNRSFGFPPTIKGDQPVAAPQPPFEATTIYDWLNNMERAVRDQNNAISRVREQMP